MPGRLRLAERIIEDITTDFVPQSHILSACRKSKVIEAAFKADLSLAHRHRGEAIERMTTVEVNDYGLTLAVRGLHQYIYADTSMSLVPVSKTQSKTSSINREALLRHATHHFKALTAHTA